MIKVVVVDDDKLVRKGLISAMPWQDFDMEVIGEASNGEKALEFLARHEVDLLLTDLSMPVMSGNELMRIVRRQYPHMHIVVLTLHQDFEYIQEAMRLGAIDYIAKVQLEKERFEEVLGRIHKRILEQEENSPGKLAGMRRDENFELDHGYVLVSTNRVSAGKEIRNEWPEKEVVLTELGINLFFFHSVRYSDSTLWPDKLLQFIEARTDWMLIRVKGMIHLTPQEAYERIRRYREGELFYDYDPSRQMLEKTLEEAGNSQQHSPEPPARDLTSDWLSLDWIYQDTLMNKLLQELKELRLPQGKLMGVLYVLADRWNQLFLKISPIAVQLQDPLDSWLEVEEWFRQIRGQIRNTLGSSGFSPEVLQSVMKAIVMLHKELDQQITATDLARRVNMSRSYFSQCFKEIVGTNFNLYLRLVRLTQAQHYLQYTNKTILWIAEHVGYEDEKYFSRSFREYIGMLPSEFRAMAHEGRTMSSKQGEK
ncbi:DNA-binding response regulator [Paenibacillus albidus]|uniref:DNA-binding response regulator n=1 Tax=Paenibacillus albidus TaxID=2041023 RepID=A0A917FI53_9BACL|nr:response regulator [Paenibacillus albidus]GGF79348.1 DNA-binding response regulator [Paenibacillus albidus]